MQQRFNIADREKANERLKHEYNKAASSSENKNIARDNILLISGAEKRVRFFRTINAFSMVGVLAVVGIFAGILFLSLLDILSVDVDAVAGTTMLLAFSMALTMFSMIVGSLSVKNTIIKNIAYSDVLDKRWLHDVFTESILPAKKSKVCVIASQDVENCILAQALDHGYASYVRTLFATYNKALSMPISLAVYAHNYTQDLDQVLKHMMYYNSLSSQDKQDVQKFCQDLNSKLQTLIDEQMQFASGKENNLTEGDLPRRDPRMLQQSV